MTLKNPKLKAEQIICDLNIRDPSELEIRNIAMEFRLFVKEESMDGAEGWLVRKNDHGIIKINKDIIEKGRKRFAIAHEIGHFKLHSDTQLVICKDQDMFCWKKNTPQEMEANEFASNLLMPESLFTPLLKNNKTPEMKSIIFLAGKFRTTLTATALRYVQLSKEPCAIAVSQDGYIKWYQKSSDFDFHIKAGKKVNPDSYAFEFFNNGELPKTSESVPAHAWLAGNFSEDSEIMEISFPLPRYNTVLSLLWVYEDIRHDYQKKDDECDYDLTSVITQDGKRWL